jgi:hypothetical protein
MRSDLRRRTRTWHIMIKKELPNQGLDLTNPDAAQSVAGAPLCLLSGLAAQAHVRPEILRCAVRERSCVER